MNLKLNLDTPSVHSHPHGTVPWQLRLNEPKVEKLNSQNRFKRYIA